MTQHETKQNGSETIGFQKLGQVALNSTGPQHGETGSQVTANDKPKVGDKDPRVTDKNLLAVLTSQFNVSRQVRGWVPIGEPDYAMIPVGDADYVGAIEVVQNSMQHASDMAISAALAVLEVSTVRGKESHDRASLGDAVYLRTLGGYPADVALSALNHFTMTSKFAPALCEIVEKCEALVQKRRDILASLIWSQGKTFKAVADPRPRMEKPDEVPNLEKPIQPPRLSPADMASQLRGMV